MTYEIASSAYKLISSCDERKEVRYLFDTMLITTNSIRYLNYVRFIIKRPKMSKAQKTNYEKRNDYFHIEVKRSTLYINIISHLYELSCLQDTDTIAII